MYSFNEFDYSARLNKILNDFVQGKTKKLPINKRNAIALSSINEVFIEYTPALRKFMLITALLKNVDMGLRGQWLNICVSLKSQKKYFISCKIRLKEEGIDDEQLKAILRGIKLFKERLIRINETVLPKYLLYTPLNEFESVLKEQGKTLDEFLEGYLENANTFELEDFDTAATVIFDQTKDNTLYLERVRKYRQKADEMKLRNKQIHSAEKLEKRKNDASEKLAYLSRSVSKNLNYNLDHFPGFDFNAIHKYKERGEILAKVIIVCKVHAGIKGKVYYVSNTDDLTTALSRALVLAEKDPIPSTIQQMVDEDKIVLTEVLFHI